MNYNPDPSILFKGKSAELDEYMDHGVIDETIDKFEKVAFLQHFNSPTRCLDFSFDPTVALYYACKNTNHLGKKGYILLAETTKESLLQNRKYVDFLFDLASLKSEIYFFGGKKFGFVNSLGDNFFIYSTREKKYIDQILGNRELSMETLVKSFDKPIFAISKTPSNREIIQSSVMMIPSNIIVYSKGEKTVEITKKNFKNYPKEDYVLTDDIRRIDFDFLYHNFAVLIIYPKVKREFLDFWEKEGLNDNTLFPES